MVARSGAGRQQSGAANSTIAPHVGVAPTQACPLPVRCNGAPAPRLRGAGPLFPPPPSVTSPPRLKISHDNCTVRWESHPSTACNLGQVLESEQAGRRKDFGCQQLLVAARTGDPSICRLCMCCFIGRGEPLLQEAFPNSVRLHRLSSPLLDFCSSTALNLAPPWTLKLGYCYFLCITENGSQCLWRNARVGVKIKPSVQHGGGPAHLQLIPRADAVLGRLDWAVQKHRVTRSNLRPGKGSSVSTVRPG